MNNLRKRILSLFLVGTMTLSMASPFAVFAEEEAMEGDLSVAAQEQGASSTAQDDTPVSEAATSDDQASALLEEAVTESTTPTPAADTTPAPQTEGEQPPAEAEEPETTPTEKQETVSAQIGEDYYTSLEDAVAAAEAGQTITLLQDVQLHEAVTVDQDLTLVAESGSTVTLSRGEGYNGALIVLNDGVLTQDESASEKAGSLVLDGGARWLVDRVVTDDEGQPLRNDQGEEEKETVEAESPAVPEAYDGNAAVTVATAGLPSMTRRNSAATMRRKTAVPSICMATAWPKASGANSPAMGPAATAVLSGFPTARPT